MKKFLLLKNLHYFFFFIFILLLGIFFLFPFFTVLNLGIYILISSISGVLLCLAKYDFKHMEVHNVSSMALLLFIFVFNIILFLLLGSEYEYMIGNSFVFSPYNNFLGALLLGSIFQLIVLVSREKALGQGDVRIALITGLLIGYSNLMLWSYITVFSSIAYALFIGKKKGKLKGLHIPFVPFMILGILTVILIKVL